MVKFLLSFFIVLSFSLSGFAQTTTFMTWNSLNFSTSQSSVARIPFFQTVLDSIQPDLLVMQEIQNDAGANNFHAAVLEYSMEMAPFVDGYGSDNALYYNPEKFEAIANFPIQTTLRNISQFVMVHLNTGDTLRIFSVHLKASNGTANRERRLSEVDSLRKVTDALSPESHYMICGDFNFYGSNEPAYQRLLEEDKPVGYFVDPIEMPGTWNDPHYAKYHTQSTRTRQFGGGAHGGMDDRFDLILFSPHFFDTEGPITYEPESTWPVGNDGNHYNDSVNAMPNASVSEEMANAIHYASDHLPVIAKLQFYNPVYVSTPTVQYDIKIFPNPSHGKFTVDLPPQFQSRIIIMDAIGRVMHEETAIDRYSLDLGHVEKGMYYARIINPMGEKVYRLVTY